MIVKLTLWLIKRVNPAQRNLLISAVLDKLGALPLRGIIQNSEEGILLNGKPLDLEKAKQLREQAIAALRNQALAIINEQVKWNAITHGLQGGMPTADIYFFRAAIWYAEEQERHLKLLAQEEPDLLQD